MDEYKVTLDIYKGPLDLLLYLIREEEINIYDIPIAKITDSYLRHLKIIKEMDLDNVGEFIIMAATLMEIKAKMLLPSNKEEEEEDPRQELVQKLLEYKRFKNLSIHLERQYQNRLLLFPRAIHESVSQETVTTIPTLEKLVLSFSHIAKTTLLNLTRTIKETLLPINTYIQRILNKLKEKSKITLDSFAENSKIEKVGFFLAILELANRKQIRLFQIIPFGKIFITKR